MLVGLGIGLAVAGGIYLYKQSGTAQRTATSKQAVTKTKPAPPPATSKKPGAKQPDSGKQTTSFDFYTLLPKMEVQIPDSAIEAANRDLPQAEDDLAYVLQTGSFRNAADAETMKARLALLGIEADVEAVVINDRETWHRVRLGPFPSLAAVNPVRRELKRHAINYILLKVRL